MIKHEPTALQWALFCATIAILAMPGSLIALSSIMAFIAWDARYLPDWWQMARVSAVVFFVAFVGTLAGVAYVRH
jgi:hypothetical protein